MMNNFKSLLFIVFIGKICFAQSCFRSEDISLENTKFNDVEKGIIRQNLEVVSSLLSEQAEGLNAIQQVNFRCLNKTMSIKYIPDSHSVLLPKNYITRRFIENTGGLISIELIGSNENYKKYIEQYSVETFYSILYDLAHEHAHAQIENFIKDYKDGTPAEQENFIQLIREKEEALADFIAGVYFRKMKLIDTFNGYKPSDTYLSYLIEYAFSLGDYNKSSKHPMKQQRLSAFILGAFSDTNLKLPLESNFNGLLGLIVVAKYFVTSKDQAPVKESEIQMELEREPYWSFDSFKYSEYTLFAKYAFDIHKYTKYVEDGIYTKNEIKKLIPKVYDHKKFIVQKSLEMFEKFDEIDEVKLEVKYNGNYYFEVSRRDIQSVIDRVEIFFIEQELVNSLFLKFGKFISN